MIQSQVKPLIRGQVGTTITLQMLRPGGSTATTVKLVRRPTARPSEGQQSNDEAASLAKAKEKGLVKSHILEKDVSIILCLAVYPSSSPLTKWALLLATEGGGRSW